MKVQYRNRDKFAVSCLLLKSIVVVKMELIMNFMIYCKLIFKLYLMGSIHSPTPVY